jgi:predicted RNA binding protein YcfA (HicA-like mRNA interferase family)
MPPFTSITRRKLIQVLKQAGFEGPYSGGNHQYLIKGSVKLFIPNPHTEDISKALLNKILKIAISLLPVFF